MSKPLISILIPFKNTAHYLADCIQSIINQTYINWELLIVDDHSVDNSFAIAELFAGKDKRIKLLKNKGNGIIEALRIGLAKSNGILITRMDSDDIMTPNKLEVLSAKLLGSGKGHIVTGLVEYFAENGIGDGYKKYETWLNTLTKTGANFNEIYKECVIPSPSWMVYKTDLIVCDAFNPNRYPEDYDLAFRFYKQGLKCIACDELVHYWRDYPIRTSRTHAHYAQNHFLDIKLHYFLELNYKPNKPLIVWGAGLKGKYVAKALVKKEIPFFWICDNPKKIGKDIYGQTLLSYQELKYFNTPQSIITVANTEAQLDIKSQLKALKMMPMLDYFFFC